VAFQQLTCSNLFIISLVSCLQDMRATKVPAGLSAEFLHVSLTKQLTGSTMRERFLSLFPTMSSALKYIRKCNFITGPRWKCRINTAHALQNFLIIIFIFRKRLHWIPGQLSCLCFQTAETIGKIHCLWRNFKDTTKGKPHSAALDHMRPFLI
jgi:hypothetical protein